MKKSDLSSHVAHEVSLSQVEASGVVDAVFAAIRDALVRDESVSIAGFGTFTTVHRAARQGRNPHRREHRHRSLEVAVVQGRQDPARRGARVGQHRTSPRTENIRVEMHSKGWPSGHGWR